MRNPKEALSDKFAKNIHDRLMEVFAPNGFQPHNKVGEVAIRSYGYSRKEIEDLIYEVILKITVTKVGSLKLIAKEIDSRRKRLWEAQAELSKLPQYDLSARIRGKYKDKQRLRLAIRTNAEALLSLEDVRMMILVQGPVIPDEVIKEQKL